MCVKKLEKKFFGIKKEMLSRPKPTVWVTRSLPAADRSSKNWSYAGFNPLTFPLLEISKPSEEPNLPLKKGILVFTSGNGVRAFSEKTTERDWSVVTVGKETQRLARKFGFEYPLTANGDSRDVANLILSNFSKDNNIYHCGGNNLQGSIVKDLLQKGYNAERLVYYNSTPIKVKPSINVNEIDYLILYSPLAARTLVKYQFNLLGVTVISISKATKDALGTLKGVRHKVSKEPNEMAIIDLVKNLEVMND
jgi:uroporphyrinogen-III synthase